MANAKVNMAEFNKSFSNLDKVFIQSIEKIETEFKKSLDNITTNAAVDTPVKTGALRASINWKEVNKLSYELRAEVPYAAYVEFGTGTFAKNELNSREFNDYWKEIAIKYKGKTDGFLPAHPYFYPNVRKEIPKLKERIVKILSKNA